MKIAIVHDWINGLRGGERCLDLFLSMYPEADVYTLLHERGTTTDRIDSRVKGQSFIGTNGILKRNYRHCLPLYPLAIRSLDLNGYDVVISLSHAAAKNVRVPKGAKHISYCFTPMRYIWDQRFSYFGKSTLLYEPILCSLRAWDKNCSAMVDAFSAISHLVAARIRKFYRRRSRVIYPAVLTDWIKPISRFETGEAFLYAGALVPYKNVDLVVRAFNKLGLPLWVVGSGPQEDYLRAIANSNVSFLGSVSDAELASYYRRSRALVFAAKEDFGMIPIECLAAGRPVICPEFGGTGETVTGRKYWQNPTKGDSSETGVFIKRVAHEGRGLNTESIVDSVRYFLTVEDTFNPESCISRSKDFSPQVFTRHWEQFFQECVDAKAKKTAI